MGVGVGQVGQLWAIPADWVDACITMCVRAASHLNLSWVRTSLHPYGQFIATLIFPLEMFQHQQQNRPETTTAKTGGMKVFTIDRDTCFGAQIWFTVGLVWPVPWRLESVQPRRSVSARSGAIIMNDEYIKSMATNPYLPKTPKVWFFVQMRESKTDTDCQE